MKHKMFTSCAGFHKKAVSDVRTGSRTFWFLISFTAVMKALLENIPMCHNLTFLSFFKKFGLQPNFFEKACNFQGAPMESQKIPRSFGTHDGTFHADEVTACALLLLFGLVDRDKIIRTRDLFELKKCDFVCDVGGIYDPEQHLFDHHQADYQGQMSSAGMVLLYLQSKGILSHKEYLFFNDALMLGVDAHDNGREPQVRGLSTYSHIIASFTPILQDCHPSQQDETFFEAVDFAKSYLERIWKRYQYIQSCREIVAEAMRSAQEYLIFEKNISWLELFFELEGVKHPAKFVIMPSGVHWKLRGIPPTYEERMKVRIPLPSEWAGLLDEELKKASGIPGAIFCHKGRFISVWETREDALQALEYVLHHHKKELK